MNCVLFVMFLALIVTRGLVLAPPWDGPAIVTVLLAIATVVLGSVALGVALLAMWGYGSLREHAAGVAREAAQKAADEAVRELFRKFRLDQAAAALNDDVAGAYAREQPGV